MIKKTLVFTAFLAIFLNLSMISGATALTLVEAPGSAFPNLLGKPTEAIRLLAANGGGTLKPIPFQIDERASETEAWFLDQDKAKPGFGVFDSQDVLIFVAEDAGPEPEASLLPASPARYRIEAAGKVAFLLLSEASAPRSEKSYVKYVPAQDRVSTGFYEAGFRPQQPLVQDILIPQNGVAKVDLLDRFKVRFNLAIKNFFDLKIGEGDVDARLAGTRVGPIRVIRRVLAAKKLGPIKLIPTATTDFYFYPDWMEIPTKVQNPVDGPKFLDANTEGLSGYDFAAAAYGSVIRSSLGEASWTLDGKPDAAPASGAAALTWWSLDGKGGSFVLGIQNDAKLSALAVHPTLKILDDAGRSAPPEGEAGESFVGFDLPYAKIPKGSYWIRVKQVFPYRFEAGREETYLQGAKTVPPNSVKAL